MNVDAYLSRSMNILSFRRIFDPLAGFFLALCVGFFAPLAPAQGGEIYQCTENGKTVFKNTGNTSGCKKLAIDPVVVPRLATRPVPAASPPNFPKVAGETQRARDSDKQRILEEELKTRQDRLAELKCVYNNGEPERLGDERNYQKYLDRTQKLKEEIERTEADVQSIRSEIGKTP
ncbi:MAG: DUF4124 domain-containing protein [Verrucomicrobiota bacterium]|nr:DUF4124 domain-containing protein [Verrucomicrobiota bacterium]